MANLFNHNPVKQSVRTESISLEETDCFSSFFLDYINRKDELKPFYSSHPEIEEIGHSIKDRSFPNDKRSKLVNVLKEQYAQLDASSMVHKNIELLKKPNTFTITTGHQLNIFTGPLYFIYKIVSVINTCKTLKQAYPKFDFVPVYWMASEDHDFDEINHFFFEGKKYEWQTDQSGAVGHFDPSGLKEILASLPKGLGFFHEAYQQKTLAEATRSYVNHLFGSEGLVVVDADHPQLKASFAEVIEDDLMQHQAEKLVLQTTEKLQKLGYKTQVNPRSVNFFFMEDGVRERIEKTTDGFKVVDTSIAFSVDQAKEMIAHSPEKFSPNVILRPLFQETVLPNLAYIGGPSEVVYWLQLKSLFEFYRTPFPMIMPRNFAMVIPGDAAKKWAKTGLSTKALFLSSEEAFTQWTKQNTSIDLSYERQLHDYGALMESLKEKAGKVDVTLIQHLDALKAITEKRLKKAEKKLLRAEKRNHEARRNQIESIKELLFPGGSPQERKVNFLNFYLKHPEFIHDLLQAFDPFDFRMNIIYE